MKEQYIDAVIIIKALTDNPKVPEENEKCRELITEMYYGKMRLRTSGTTICEIEKVLGRTFKQSREKIAAILSDLVDCEDLKIRDKFLVKRAIEIYESASRPLPLADCYIVADCEMSELTELLSYDNDFDQFEQIKRIKP